MNDYTLDKIHVFGKVGKIVMLGFAILFLLASISQGRLLSIAASVRADAAAVTLSDQAEIRVNTGSLSAVRRLFSRMNSSDAQLRLLLENDAIAEAGGQALEASVSLFDHSYSTVRIRAEGEMWIIDAASDPVSISAGSLIVPLLFLLLKMMALTALAWTGSRVFEALEYCDSPFCAVLVRRLRAFGWCLLPLAVFASAEATASQALLFPNVRFSLRLQWGYLLAFAVTVFLTAVFRYGVQLQRESDETL